MEGIADADAHLGRPVPLPAAALPLARWVDVSAAGPSGVEVVWNLDDTREGAPGRLALYAGHVPPPPHPLGTPETVRVGDADGTLRRAPHEEAQPSLRPVAELEWRHDGLHLRLTAQGAWDLQELVRVAASISG